MSDRDRWQEGRAANVSMVAQASWRKLVSENTARAYLEQVANHCVRSKGAHQIHAGGFKVPAVRCAKGVEEVVIQGRETRFANLNWGNSTHAHQGHTGHQLRSVSQSQCNISTPYTAWGVGCGSSGQQLRVIGSHQTNQRSWPTSCRTATAPHTTTTTTHPAPITHAHNPHLVTGLDVRHTLDDAPRGLVSVDAERDDLVRKQGQSSPRGIKGALQCLHHLEGQHILATVVEHLKDTRQGAHLSSRKTQRRKKRKMGARHIGQAINQLHNQKRQQAASSKQLKPSGVETAGGPRAPQPHTPCWERGTCPRLQHRLSSDDAWIGVAFCCLGTSCS